MKRLIFGIGLLVLSLPVFADIQAYTLPATPPAFGNQDWQGPLGMDFQVNQAIRITALGVFVNAGAHVPTVPLTVQLFSLDSPDTNPTTETHTTGTPVPGALPVTIPSGYTSLGSSNWVFLPVSVILQPGYYTVAAWGYGPSEPNGNTQGNAQALTPSVLNTGGNLITFIGESRYDTTPSGFPSIPDYWVGGGPVNRYYAGNFEFVAAPEYNAALLLAANLLGFALRRRFATR